MSNSRTKTLVLCALFVALLAVSCFFTIPLGPVPFTLQTMVVILIALLFTPKQAAAITGIYLFMGACGLPVFSSMHGGMDRLLGPSGGFLMSFFIGAVAASALRLLLEKRRKQIIADIVCAASIIIISDIIGWLWLALVANMDLLSAFIAADAPFIAIDCCKAVVAILIASALRKVLPAQRMTDI